MTAISHPIKSRFTAPSNEELETHAMVTLTGLSPGISKIVFSYLFDVNKSFGSQFPDLTTQSETDFQIASTKIHTSKVESVEQSRLTYPSQGRKEYVLWGPVENASALILEHIFSHTTDRPYLLLDIGGASGDFALSLENAIKPKGRSIEGHTVSASDLRAKHSQVLDARYHICNASNILTCESISSRSWNSIVCVMTLMYFGDNAKNLADFYKLLAPNGLLIVKDVFFLGIHENPREMIEFLNEIGYAVIAFYQNNDAFHHRISTLILQKSHPHLNFPITYDADTPCIQVHSRFKALYSPDPRFMTMGDDQARRKRISSLTRKKSWFSTEEVQDSVFPKKTHPLTTLYERALKRH